MVKLFRLNLLRGFVRNEYYFPVLIYVNAYLSETYLSEVIHNERSNK